MDNDELKTYLQALASGRETANVALVEAYLETEASRTVAGVVKELTRTPARTETKLLPPSGCLVLLH